MLVVGDDPPAVLLAAHLGLDRVPDLAGVPAGALWLGRVEGRLALGSTAPGAPRTALAIDFGPTSPAWNRRLRASSRHEPLARALGPATGGDLLDATAGLGRDSVLAARAGHRVLAVERSPIVTALLDDGLARAGVLPDLLPVVARIELRCADSRELLAAGAWPEPPAVVYIDPMFPPRDKSALVKKPMQLLQALLPADDDGAELLALALACGARRVVVKRPAGSPPLPASRAPASRLAGGRTTRYDVYCA